MPELYLIRHGLAGERGTHTRDEERPLTEKGGQKTRLVARKLADLQLKFDLILTSPLVRAKQTAEILRSEGLGDRLQEFPGLAPGGNLHHWLDWWQSWQVQNRCLACVGHQPDLGNWAEMLIWGEASEKLILKKAGIIGLQLPELGLALKNSYLFWLTSPKYLL